MKHQRGEANISYSSGMGIASLFIFFWGNPDIADAIIHFLMTAGK